MPVLFVVVILVPVPTASAQGEAAAAFLPTEFSVGMGGEIQAQASQAQEEPSRPSRFQAGLGMMLGVPVGDFGDNVEVAAGVSVQFLTK